MKVVEAGCAAKTQDECEVLSRDCEGYSEANMNSLIDGDSRAVHASSGVVLTVS